MRRYVTQEQRKAENEGVTEDDVNEIKNDISAFRFELIEILKQSGMKVESAAGHLGTLVVYLLLGAVFSAEIESRSKSRFNEEARLTLEKIL